MTGGWASEVGGGAAWVTEVARTEPEALDVAGGAGSALWLWTSETVSFRRGARGWAWVTGSARIAGAGSNSIRIGDGAGKDCWGPAAWITQPTKSACNATVATPVSAVAKPRVGLAFAVTV